MKSLSLLRPIRNNARLGLGLLTLLSASLPASAQPPADVNLPAPAKGTAAIAALGAHLPTVAKAYGLDPQELATLFQLQPSLGVDTAGALLVSCDLKIADLEAAKKEATSSDLLSSTSSTTQLASGSTVDAFKLHSLPGASRVIFLDFDGQTTSGTSWNSAYTGGAPIVSAPFDMDGDPSTFSAVERATIQGIWKRVAEDYAPFAIDVTTEDPGVEALRKTTSSDNAYGIRVVISPTNWYSGGVAGTAYIGSFNWSSDTPCWVFSSSLGNGEKYIAECISHETGHTVGLYHDGLGGSAPTEYYGGQGNWAPIMGMPLYQAVTQFSKGEYANANNTQDDTSVITTYAPLVGDDHGNTLSAATTLNGPTLASGGTIETRTDVDIFRFDTGAGAISLNVVSPTLDQDLHIKAELLDGNGSVVLVNDSSLVNASFNTTLAAGTYYLRINGIGFGDPVSTGYSDYGSLGNYLITGSLVAISGRQAPTSRITTSATSGVAPLTVNFSGQNSTDPDGSIVSYAWDFGNGTSGSGVNASCTYNTAGSFIAVLTVTDNDGLASSSSVLISTSAAANVAPTAVASASTTNGTAPLAINFSSTGSSDPDGSISSYRWTFGDGSSSTAANPSKTYTSAGTYSVVLTVTDNAGATASSSLSISVTSNPNAAVDVKEYALSRSTTNAGTSAIGLVRVYDALGQPVAGVTVTIQWSGLVSNKTSGKTDAYGQVMVTSGRTKKTGTITGKIMTITPPSGLTYDAGLYSVSDTASISVN